MLAPDGRCKTLDAAADGYVRAEAVGILGLSIINSLGHSSSTVKEEQKRPHVLILSAAVNQDGRYSYSTSKNKC